MSRHSRSLLASYLLAALTACGDGTGPAPSEGFYVLTDANGHPLPVLVAATVTCDQSLTRGTLDLGGDGTFALVGTVLSDCTRSGGSSSTAIVTVSGTYQAGAGRVALTPAAPGSPEIAGSYDATELRATIPASPQTFPIALSTSFRFVGPPPP